MAQLLGEDIGRNLLAKDWRGLRTIATAWRSRGSRTTQLATIAMPSHWMRDNVYYVNSQY